MGKYKITKYKVLQLPHFSKSFHANLNVKRRRFSLIFFPEKSMKYKIIQLKNNNLCREIKKHALKAH